MYKKKFYLVNQSCGPLFIDIVNEFVKSGLDITLITGQVTSVQHALDSHVKLKKLNQYNRSSIPMRVASWLHFTFILFLIILLSPQKSIWLISTNPPFAPWLLGILRLRKIKSALLVYDIYPEALVAADIISKKNILYKIWDKMTQYSYKNANHIICIGDTMADYLISQNKDLKSKIIVIPNWNVLNFKTFEKNENAYRIKRNARNKIHIVYSGNLGATHDFITILEIAKRLKNDNRFVFSIIGEGFEEIKIKQFIKENQLENILWEAFKPPNEVSDVFLSADIFLITLGKGIEKSSIPSKTYDALAAGSALLVISPKGSELENLVIFNNIGACFNPGEVGAVINWLEDLVVNQEKLNQYKKASKTLSEKYSPLNANKYVQVLTSV